jgi:benzodiazapine receptor
MPSELYLPNLLLWIPRNPVTAIGIPMCLGLFSGWPSHGTLDGPWYKSLKHPPGRPGRLLPPICWGVMYTCVGYASHLAVKYLDKEPVQGSKTRRQLKRGLALYYAQLGLNLIYTPIFLGAQQLGWSLADSTGMALISYTMMGVLHKATESKTTYFLAPYCVWLTYATYMNAGLWWLNKD